MHQQSQTQTPENSLDFLWAMVLVVTTILLVWYFGKTYITSAIFFVKLWEIAAVKFVFGFWDKLASFLHLPIANFDILNKWIGVINKQAGPASINTLIQVNADVGKFTRYPIIFALLIIAAGLYFGSVASKFKTVFDMKRLKNTEKENWPRIVPVANLNLVNTDINEGPWAMAMTPMQFCKKNNLLKEEIKNGKPTVSLIRGQAHRVFALQLGPLWNGRIDVLPEHIQALLAVFMTRIAGDIDRADELLDQIAASAGNGKLDFGGVNGLLRKYMNTKPAVKVMQRHAYVTTMMASMLELTRDVGVLCSADFLWLRPFDRKLWYVLNSVGRQTVASEVAGVFAHWLVEKKFQYPIKTPMIDTAVNGLEEAINEILYEPEEQ